MVGHRLGEFSLTRKFVKHGGKMQKEQDLAKKDAELAAAKSAKAKPILVFSSLPQRALNITLNTNE